MRRFFGDNNYKSAVTKKPTNHHHTFLLALIVTEIVSFPGLQDGVQGSLHNVAKPGLRFNTAFKRRLWRSWLSCLISHQRASESRQIKLN